MMGGVRSVAENLAGAWEVMIGKAEGLNRVDTSLEGFWRSFAAVILVIPFALLMHYSQASLEAELVDSVPQGNSLLVDGMALLCDWFAFPVVFALIARPFGLASRYVPFIVTRNWGSVIISALTGVLFGLHLLGVVPGVVMPYAFIAVFAVALRFYYLIARTTLQVSMGMTLPIVLLDFLLTLTIGSAFARL